MVLDDDSQMPSSGAGWSSVSRLPHDCTASSRAWREDSCPETRPPLPQLHGASRSSAGRVKARGRGDSCSRSAEEAERSRRGAAQPSPPGAAGCHPQVGAGQCWRPSPGDPGRTAHAHYAASPGHGPPQPAGDSPAPPSQGRCEHRRVPGPGWEASTAPDSHWKGTCSHSSCAELRLELP